MDNMENFNKLIEMLFKTEELAKDRCADAQESVACEPNALLEALKDQFYLTMIKSVMADEREYKYLKSVCEVFLSHGIHVSESLVIFKELQELAKKYGYDKEDPDPPRGKFE